MHFSFVICLYQSQNITCWNKIQMQKDILRKKYCCRISRRNWISINFSDMLQVAANELFPNFLAWSWQTVIRRWGNIYLCILKMCLLLMYGDMNILFVCYGLWTLTQIDNTQAKSCIKAFIMKLKKETIIFFLYNFIEHLTMSTGNMYLLPLR